MVRSDVGRIVQDLRCPAASHTLDEPSRAMGHRKALLLEALQQCGEAGVNQLGRYLETTSRTTDEVAVDLSALLGKPITAQSVLLWSRRRKPPKAWAAALSLPDEVADPQEERYLDDDVPAGTERLLRDDDAPPAPLDPSTG